MTVKRKDFQKAAAFIHEFLLKLNEEAECAELRDTLNLVLLHMQKYYRTLQVRTHEKSFQQTLSLTTRGLSPLTPFVDAPDKFQWKWLNLDSARVTSSIAVEESINFVVLPPMIQATKQGDLKYMLQLSQTEGSSVDDRDGIGRTSLMYAVHFGQLDALKILLQNDADPNATAHDGSTALHRACHDSNTMALHILLEFGGELGLQDSQGRAPLHWAVTTLSLDCLKLLLQYGADVTVKDKDGLTASMWACRLDHINHFELLSSADVNPASHPDGIERDNNGRTWMHWAIRRTEPLECLQTLLTEETAKIKDDDGKTVLLLAAEQGSLAACRVILDIAGPERLRDQDDQERCAVHLAAIGGHGDVLNLLLERGADLSVHDKYAATAWDYAKNRQLHYCQLILLSHQRQRLESNPSTPNGLGLLDNQPFLNGGTEEENDNYMNMKNRGDFKPITPPHPPKRPRTGRTPLSRRASSLNMAATPDSELGQQRDVVSADNDRRKGRIEVTVQSRRPVSRQFVPSGRHEVSMSIDDDVQQGVHADEEVEEVMGGGMDVSDIDDDAEDTPHPSKPRPGMLQRRRLSGQGQTTPSQNPFTPQPPPFNKSLSSPAVSQSYTGPLQPSYNLANPAADYMGPAPVGGGDMIRAPPTTPRHHIPSPPQRPGLTPLNRTPLGRVGGSAFVPTPPQSAAMNQSGLLPTPPSAGQRSDSPSRPGSGSSQDRDRPGSGGRPNSGSLSPAGDPGTAKPSPPPKSQPPGILEGKKIPPPMLTPLRNAPKPPPLDGHKGRKKKKKKRREGMMAASPLEGIPTPAPAEFGPQFNPPPPAASNRGRQSAAPPPPFQSKSLPQKAENSVDDVSHGSDEAPPMVSGHAYPIRNVPPRERSARPRDLRPTNQAHGEESMEVQGEADPDNNNDDISVVQLNSVVGGGEIIPEEEEEGVGPLIPPPQAFRGNSGQTRPLSQSIPQEGRSARLAAPSSAKPPLPRGRSAAGSAGQTGTYRRHRGRPPTSKSGLF